MPIYYLSMFGSLSEKLEAAFKKIRGTGSLSEKDIQNTMREVRMALLEADVNYKVAKDFCQKVSDQAIGQDISKNLKPDQEIIKLVHNELVH